VRNLLANEETDVEMTAVLYNAMATFVFVMRICQKHVMEVHNISVC